MNLLTSNVEIPRAGHPGSFGFQRRNHIHEGVDLYGTPGDPVYTFNDGVINAIYPFTGERVNMPWWNETDAIAVEDDRGSWVYGEIAINDQLYVGQKITKGTLIGHLTPVLKNDKGRPMTMLHVERWVKGVVPYTMLWELNQPQPWFLEDPTPYLEQFYHP